MQDKALIFELATGNTITMSVPFIDKEELTKKMKNG